MKKCVHLLFFISVSTWASGQCSMCRANAKTSLQNGSNAAAGLNAGIEYLLLVPYIAAGVIAIAFYVNYRKRNLNRV